MARRGRKRDPNAKRRNRTTRASRQTDGPTPELLTRRAEALGGYVFCRIRWSKSRRRFENAGPGYTVPDHLMHLSVDLPGRLCAAGCIAATELQAMRLYAALRRQAYGATSARAQTYSVAEAVGMGDPSLSAPADLDLHDPDGPRPDETPAERACRIATRRYKAASLAVRRAAGPEGLRLLQDTVFHDVLPARISAEIGSDGHPRCVKIPAADQRPFERFLRAAGVLDSHLHDEIRRARLARLNVNPRQE